MLKTTGHVLTLLLVCAICMSFAVSCIGGISSDEAKTLINDFFAEITAEDYEGAEALFHPDCDVDVKAYIEDIERRIDVDFQKGITIETYTGFSNMFYNSTINGSASSLVFMADVEDVSMQVQITIVKNDVGYGIYYINIDAYTNADVDDPVNVTPI